MIYTLGHKRSYETALLENPDTQKVGRYDDYPGGSVWKTREEAAAYIADNGLTEYTVYGVEADWDKDTEPSKDGPWHDLLRDATLRSLEPIGAN